MKTKKAEFEVLVPNIDGTEVAERIKVSIPLRWDEELGEWLLTPEAHQIIENTKARRMGLLLPAQFKQLRERYDYSQQEMGELFQVGEKSWTRWESGKQRPSRSINLLIRALYEGEISVNYLLKRAGKPSREEPEWSSVVSHWQTFAQCQFRYWEIPTQQITEHIAVIYTAGSGKSAFLEQKGQVLRRQILGEKICWEGLKSTSSAEKPVSIPEGSTPRFKFPSVA